MTDGTGFAGLDVTVMQVETLPDFLPEGVRVGKFTEAQPGQLLFRMPGVGAYLVRDGNNIEYTVVSGADPGAVELYLYGVARAALMHQRGELPLHASALVPPGGGHALALCGPSGAGKSTLAMELSRRGWSLLADDISRITWDGKQAVVWPGERDPKLWADACARLGIATEGLRRVRARMEKFYVPVARSTEPAPLSVVLVLKAGGHSRLERLRPSEQLGALSAHTFRRRHVQPLGILGEHLRMVSLTAGSAMIGRLHGARRRPVEELADMVEEAQRWSRT